MKNKVDFWGKRLVLSFFGFAILCTLFGWWISTLPQTYTIAEITKVIINRKGVSIFYKYNFAGNEYSWTLTAYRHNKTYIKELHQKGKKFYVRVPKYFDSFGRLMTLYPVIDSTQKSPERGWTLEEFKKIVPNYKE